MTLSWLTSMLTSPGAWISFVVAQRYAVKKKKHCTYECNVTCKHVSPLKDHVIPLLCRAMMVNKNGVVSHECIIHIGLFLPSRFPSLVAHFLIGCNWSAILMHCISCYGRPCSCGARSSCRICCVWMTVGNLLRRASFCFVPR